MTPEVERALGCLYLACHAEVAADVERIVRAALKAKDLKIEELEKQIEEGRRRQAESGSSDG